MSTCVITGGAGNLACQLTWALSGHYQRIVLFDLAANPVGKIAPNAEFEQGDLLDSGRLEGLFDRVQAGTVIHLASMLSGNCEQNRRRGWQVNVDGAFILFEAMLRLQTMPKVLFASSIAAFGGQLPAVLTDETQQWPDSLYGVTKMAVERLGVYYHRRHRVDFRCVRLPITISRHAPAGAASALASHAFIEAARAGRFTFHSHPDTKLALIYVTDVLHAFVGLLAAPAASLTRQVYNIGSMTVTPSEIADAIRRRLPRAALRFEPKEPVAALLASWPGAIDDSAARRDWDWRPKFDLDAMSDEFIDNLNKEFNGVSK